MVTERAGITPTAIVMGGFFFTASFALVKLAGSPTSLPIIHSQSYKV